MTTATLELATQTLSALMSLPEARRAQYATRVAECKSLTISRAAALVILRQVKGMGYDDTTTVGDLPREPGNGGQQAARTAPDWASEKQASYAADLLRTRVAPDERVIGTVKTAAEHLALFAACGKMPRATARTVIDMYRERPRYVAPAPKAPAAAPKPVAAEVGSGMYLVEGVVYKVQKAIHGSGRMYAKRLVVHGEGEASFEYEGGAIRRIQPGHKMTLEQAREFGAVYGVCCQCGTTLTDEKSIEAGIGPVCAKKF